jgi:hydroxymethylpyrimidine/phosphomethylpyrimidine kinase
MHSPPPDPPAVLSVAGSDPSGGAGIQADLKTFCICGVYGMAVPAMLTVQNTHGVQSVHPLPEGLVRDQLDAILRDCPPAAIKIGALGSESAVREVAGTLAGFDGPIVLDPVLISTSGARLLPAKAEHALASLLVPMASLVTPNRSEADLLFGSDPPSVPMLLTGGDATGGTVTDELVLPDGTRHRWSHPRIWTRNHHGTGCTLSSAIASWLAWSLPLEDACGKAVDMLQKLLTESAEAELGGGCGPLLHHRLCSS